MAKNVPPHLRDKAAKCLFCNEPGLSKTHIWPRWLNELLSPPVNREVLIERPTHHRRAGTERELRQGSIFNQKPHLACIGCNTGWMKDFEDKVASFGKPLFAGGNATVLCEDQVRSLAGWITLVAILAQYIDESRIDIVSTRSDLDCIWKQKVPPDHWSIFAASQNGNVWNARYRSRSTNVADYASVQQFMDTVKAGVDANTQLSSFGIGSLFIQVFICPFPRFVDDYRTVTNEAGLNQIWPLPTGRLWPYHKQGTAQFPTKLVLGDQTAQALADTYYERLNRLSALSV
jgi:hypothetical protein